MEEEHLQYLKGQETNHRKIYIFMISSAIMKIHQVKTYFWYTLKILATVIAVSNIGCAIHRMHTDHAQILEFSIVNENNITEHFESFERNSSGSNFNGAVAVLVANGLLTVGIFANIDLFLYIWLFVYGSFMVVAVFIAPETYQKLPGISHSLSKVLSQKYLLSKDYRPLIYICFKSVCCLVITAILVLKKNISVFAARYHHSPIGSKTKTKKKKIKGSPKITTNAATQSGTSDTFDLRDENFIVEETPDLGRRSAKSTSTNTTSLGSTSTLVSQMTSTPSVANSIGRLAKDSNAVSINYSANHLHQSEECSFDVLRTGI